MLSYQHGFHVGNFADVHKHLILTLVLQALNRKSKPWSYLETHSGRGRYALDSEQAQKKAEYKEGVGKIWGEEFGNEIDLYLDYIRRCNPGDELTAYPGSPMLAAQSARAEDRIHLMELHPQEVVELRREFRSTPQVGVHHRDGYEGVLSLMPPKPNRGLVLIDPAYEVKSEYEQVPAFLEQASARWPNGSFAVWYPILGADRWKKLRRNLSSLSSGLPVLDSIFLMSEPKQQGMYGSGMLLINPPWQIDQQIERVMPDLIKALSPRSGSAQLEWLREPS